MGVDPDLATAPSIGLGVTGSRTDTMVMLHVGDDGTRMMSLPRDLWVDIDGGGAGKLNSATVSGGAPALLRTVQSELDLPVQRYLEVDIAGFLEVVDAVGSITIEFPRPACDPKSGLMIRQRGPVELGPQRALAYVRSRTYTEFSAAEVRRALGPDATCDQIISSGLGQTDGTADIGRGERQRRFLLAVFDEIGSSRNPVTLLQVLGGLSNGLRIDDEMGMFDAISLARKMRGADIESVTLPVVPFDPGGTSALLPCPRRERRCSTASAEPTSRRSALQRAVRGRDPVVGHPASAHHHVRGDEVVVEHDDVGSGAGSDDAEVGAPEQPCGIARGGGEGIARAGPR